MALLDVVSDVLFDPLFMDDITVIRSQRSVNVQGLTVDTPGYYYSTGCVQPTPGRDLEQLPEAERTGVFVTVVTPFRLFPLTATTAPDQIVWQQKNYRVKHVADWSNFGQGFVSAICQLVDMVPDGP
jgi:galactose-6-phosphate isomerase